MSTADSTSATPPAPSRYIVGPGFDLLFVINLPWLLFAAAHSLFISGVLPDFATLSIFFVTLPHRFATLPLVFLDRSQFSTRPRVFIGLPIAFVVLFFALRALGDRLQIGSEAVLCVFAIDYAWNAYHFGAQHYGIARIYGKKSGSGSPRLERAILVGGVGYTLISTASWLIVDTVPSGVYLVADLAVAASLALLVIIEAVRGVPSPPKLAYLASVTLLYGGILVLPHVGLGELRLGLVASTGFFHAVEYLAIVHFYVGNKHRADGFAPGLMRSAAPVIGPVILASMLVLGTVGYLGQALTPELYLFVLVVGSFCHYAYDGMIRKLRKPSVARSLDAGGAA